MTNRKNVIIILREGFFIFYEIIRKKGEDMFWTILLSDVTRDLQYPDEKKTYQRDV